MILVQLTKDHYDSIDGLIASAFHAWERIGSPELAARWQDISARFNPIAADEPTALWSPFCPSCKAEMALEEHDLGLPGEMTVTWACDCCDTVMELRTHHRKEE